MSLTNFPNGISSFGVPVVPNFTGNHFFVKPHSGSDAADGRSPDKALKTLAKALAKATANNGDVVHLISESNTAANTTDYQSVALDWNKDGVHLIGENAGALLGQRSRISNLSTAAPITGGLLIVSANNCYIANVEVFQGAAASNPTGASIAVKVTGQRNHFYNCQFSGIGHSDLDDASSRSLLVSGSENLFKHCYLGLDTIIRATATAEVELSAGARHTFEDCVINSYTSLSTFKAVKCGSPDRFAIFKNCMIMAIQNISSAVAPTGAIDSGSVNGFVALLGTAVFGYANVTTADDSKTLVSGPAGGLVDMGLATGVDIA